MFGLSVNEIGVYRDLAQIHAVNQVAPAIMDDAEILTPFEDKARGKPKPDMSYVAQIVSDIETIITLMTLHIAYEYAHQQESSIEDESTIINAIHARYEPYLINQFISYGISFDSVSISRILGEIILELPYMYATAIDDEAFNPDLFLEEGMDAYEDYLSKNFPDYIDSEDEGDVKDDE